MFQLCPNTEGLPKTTYSGPTCSFSSIHLRPLKKTRSIAPVPSVKRATRRWARPFPTLSMRVMLPRSWIQAAEESISRTL